MEKRYKLKFNQDYKICKQSDRIVHNFIQTFKNNNINISNNKSYEIYSNETYSNIEIDDDILNIKCNNMNLYVYYITNCYNFSQITNNINIKKF